MRELTASEKLAMSVINSETLTDAEEVADAHGGIVALVLVSVMSGDDPAVRLVAGPGLQEHADVVDLLRETLRLFTEGKVVDVKN